MAGGSFALDLSAFARRAGARADAIVRKIVLDVATRVVERSPVGNPDLWQGGAPKGYVGGRFRANWQYGNYGGAGIPMGALDVVDASGAASLARIGAGLPEQAAGLRHVLINNLPYAMRLETGWSRQAPYGMVGLVVAEFGTIVRQAAEALP